MTTYTNRLRLVKQAVGANPNTWGIVYNQEFADLIDTAIAGQTIITMADADRVLTAANGATDESRAAVLRFDGTLTADRDITVPPTSKLYYVRNNTGGGFSLTFKSTIGAGVTVLSGKSALIFATGSEVIEPVTQLSDDAIIKGFSVGYLEIPQRIVTTDTTLTMEDSGRHLYHPHTEAGSVLITIPSNGAVPFPIGTAITFANDLGAGPMTVQITSDTLILAPTGATGTRSIIPAGTGTMFKMAPTRWIISGNGVV